MQQHHYVYILTNSSKKVLYTSVTNQLCQRITQHYMDRGTLNHLQANTIVIGCSIIRCMLISKMQ